MWSEWVERRNSDRVYWGKMMGRDHLADCSVDGRIILKRILNK
jgi:hypothetical protein